MLQPKALDHVGLKVTDMDKTLRFYQRLGLTLLRTSGPNANGLRSAVIQVGSQELNVFSHPDFVSSGKENPVGMDHFCLIVDASMSTKSRRPRRRSIIKFAVCIEDSAYPASLELHKILSGPSRQGRGRRGRPPSRRRERRGLPISSRMVLRHRLAASAEDRLNHA